MAVQHARPGHTCADRGKRGPRAAGPPDRGTVANRSSRGTRSSRARYAASALSVAEVADERVEIDAAGKGLERGDDLERDARVVERGPGRAAGSARAEQRRAHADPLTVLDEQLDVRAERARSEGQPAVRLDDRHVREERERGHVRSDADIAVDVLVEPDLHRPFQWRAHRRPGPKLQAGVPM